MYHFILTFIFAIEKCSCHLNHCLFESELVFFFFLNALKNLFRSFTMICLKCISFYLSYFFGHRDYWHCTLMSFISLGKILLIFKNIAPVTFCVSFICGIPHPICSSLSFYHLWLLHSILYFLPLFLWFIRNFFVPIFWCTNILCCI